MRKTSKGLKETGQAIAEFAIILPFLLTLLCAILDFGWLYLNEYETNHAAYEGARYVATHIKNAGMTEEYLTTTATAVVKTNMRYGGSTATVEYDGLYVNAYPTLTVTSPVTMLTFVGATLLGPQYDIVVSCTFCTT